MNKRLSSSAIGVLVAYTGLSIEAAAQVDSRCENFQELLRQPGIEIGTYIPDSPLLAGEALSPVIVATNRSARSLEVPDFQKATGVAVRHSAPGILPRTPAAAYEMVKGCTFPKITLHANERREFVLLEKLGNPFEEELANRSASFARADRNPGWHRYTILAGRTELVGQYETVRASVGDFNCLEKRLTPDQDPARHSSERSLQPSASGRYCRLFLIAEAKGRLLLMAAGADDSVERFRSMLELRERMGEETGEQEMISRTPFRIMEVPAGASFTVPRATDMVSLEGIGIRLGDEKRWNWSRLKAEYAPKNRR